MNTTQNVQKIQNVHFRFFPKEMEVTITEFRKNTAKYFDLLYFYKQPLTLVKRKYKINIIPQKDKMQRQNTKIPKDSETHEALAQFYNLDPKSAEFSYE